ncbi:Uncharacterized protein ChrSV_1726 [Chromobacterium vaccinii]|nr:Uncharacterized protein ChrSW_1726 [Chromobacterium vaccinii]QND89184.1 Uncharacterized protein ChrSV_1726 [Chromobacterium vaccinii]
MDGVFISICGLNRWIRGILRLPYAGNAGGMFRPAARRMR